MSETYTAGWFDTEVTIGKEYIVKHEDCCGSLAFRSKLVSVGEVEDRQAYELTFENGVHIDLVGSMEIEEVSHV